MSTSLNIATLRMEYDALVAQLAAAEADQSPFMTVPSRTFWGGGALDVATVADAAACESMCADADKCTGATFNTNSGVCHVRSGNSGLTVAGADGDTAIVRAGVQKARILQLLNQRITELSAAMTTAMSAGDTDADTRAQQAAELAAAHKRLEAQRAVLADTGAGSELLATEYKEDMIAVDHSRAVMMVWYVIAVIVVLGIAQVVATGVAPPRAVLVIAVATLVLWAVATMKK